MSYTLRGRVETRLAAALLPFLVAAVLAPILHKWWPLELAGLMLADRARARRGASTTALLPYQPGWLALPLGLLELGLTMGAARLLEVNAPLCPALALFAGAWLVLQVLAHAGLPLLRLTLARGRRRARPRRLRPRRRRAGRRARGRRHGVGGRAADGPPRGRHPPGPARPRPRADADRASRARSSAAAS